MLTLLIIADDFTGALDTGVQFAEAGAKVRVVTDIGYDFEQLDSEVQVLVMDAETRHIDPKQAYGRIFEITKRAVSSGIPYIYKKTDSALRGNIGSELSAVLDASGAEILPFLPAFPEMGRTTKKGIHYIDKVPVAESVFGADPFEPVRSSYIPDIIAEQSKTRVCVADADADIAEKEDEKTPAIVIYDTGEHKELEELGKKLFEQKKLSVMAGCAGFASVLSDILRLKGSRREEMRYTAPFLVVCGSLNPITVSQITYAQNKGFNKICLKAKQKLVSGYWESSEGKRKLDEWMKSCVNEADCIIDSGDDPETAELGRQMGMDIEAMRSSIAASLGAMLKGIFDRGFNGTVLVTGGDTLMGFMKQANISEMEPICEPAPGTVLSRFRYKDEWRQMISKSGGFGKPELLVRLSEAINRKEEVQYVEAV